jgi:hypothetical protein
MKIFITVLILLFSSGIYAQEDYSAIKYKFNDLAFQSEKKTAKLYKYLNKYLTNKGENHYIYYLLYLLSDKAGNHEGALVNLKKAYTLEKEYKGQKEFDSNYIRFALAREYRSRDKTENSIKFYKELLENGINESYEKEWWYEANYEIGNYYYLQMNYELAINQIIEVYNVSNNNVESKNRRIENLLNRIIVKQDEILFQEGNFEKISNVIVERKKLGIDLNEGTKKYLIEFLSKQDKIIFQEGNFEKILSTMKERGKLGVDLNEGTQKYLIALRDSIVELINTQIGLIINNNNNLNYETGIWRVVGAKITKVTFIFDQMDIETGKTIMNLTDYRKFGKHLYDLDVVSNLLSRIYTLPQRTKPYVFRRLKNRTTLEYKEIKNNIEVLIDPSQEFKYDIQIGHESSLTNNIINFKFKPKYSFLEKEEPYKETNTHSIGIFGVKNSKYKGVSKNLHYKSFLKNFYMIPALENDITFALGVGTLGRLKTSEEIYIGNIDSDYFDTRVHFILSYTDELSISRNLDKLITHLVKTGAEVELENKSKKLKKKYQQELDNQKNCVEKYVRKFKFDNTVEDIFIGKCTPCQVYTTGAWSSTSLLKSPSGNWFYSHDLSWTDKGPYKTMREAILEHYCKN